MPEIHFARAGNKPELENKGWLIQAKPDILDTHAGNGKLIQAPHG